MTSDSAAGNETACVEHGIWKAVPTPPPRDLNAFTLHFKDVDATEHDRIAQSGRMTFHMVGCSGDYSDHGPQLTVAAGMTTQIQDVGAGGAGDQAATTPSFLYHLGDVIYKPGATSALQPEDAADDSAAANTDYDVGRMYND
jgi:hypothetical protein